MRIIKRDGREETFDIQKVKNAINGANKDLDQKGLHKETLRQEGVDYVASVIQSWAEDLGHTPSVEEVQNEVHNLLAEIGRYELARQYEAYRTEHKVARESSDDLYKRIVAITGGLSEEVKQENSNKNPTIMSTQRDYMAGEVSKDITRKYLLPRDIIAAHDEGIIHVHDMDYYAQPMTNCFKGSTRLVTNLGVVRFDSLHDGQSIQVVDKDGNLRDATVHTYGKQPMQEVVLKSGPTTKKVVVTPNHRWLLSDGSVTTNLAVGDHLIATPDRQDELWHVESIGPHNNGELQLAWCVEEPVTHSFTLDGGIVTGNCCLVNLDDMLQNGTVITGTLIERPHTFSTACTITTQVIAQVSSGQFGGQTINLAHISPFVQASREKFSRDVRAEAEATGVSYTDEQFAAIVESRVRDDIKKGIQTIQYQLITLLTTNGQAPFVTIGINLADAPEGQPRDDLYACAIEMLEQRYEGVKAPNGAWVTPAFPKIIVVLDEDNITPDSKYYDIIRTSAKVTARRLVPDYVSAKIMRKYKLSKGEVEGEGDVYVPMGCRSFLTPDRSGNGCDNVARAKNWQPDTPKYWGRFNVGVTTINLADVALSSNKDFDEFWRIFEERLELCHKSLKLRYERLSEVTSDVAPILWQHGALARLEPGEKIYPLFFNGNATISLGYAALYECVKYMTGFSHTDHENGGYDFAIAVMQKMNDKCNEWKAAENIDYSIYGTPEHQRVA